VAVAYLRCKPIGFSIPIIFSYRQTTRDQFKLSAENRLGDATDRPMEYCAADFQATCHKMIFAVAVRFIMREEQIPLIGRITLTTSLPGIRLARHSTLT
jgi:hypothetical protein